MARVLLTGMSGTGKSTVLGELARRGIAVVDADDAAWSRWQSLPDGSTDWVWDREAMDDLLESRTTGALVVAGCSPTQGSFYDRFAAVVLLSAPAEVILARIATRTDNDFGKSHEERAKVLADLAEVEPLLRATASVELDASRPVAEIADVLEALARA
jgi:dephospho-CoA kinase